MTPKLFLNYPYRYTYYVLAAPYRSYVGEVCSRRRRWYEFGLILQDVRSWPARRRAAMYGRKLLAEMTARGW